MPNTKPPFDWTELIYSLAPDFIALKPPRSRAKAKTILKSGTRTSRYNAKRLKADTGVSEILERLAGQTVRREIQRKKKFKPGTKGLFGGGE